VKLDLKQVEETAKELYIRALKLLPPDLKQGFDALAARETDADRAERLRGKGKGFGSHHFQRRPLCLTAIEDVEDHARAEA